MLDEIDLSTVNPAAHPEEMTEIRRFLEARGLDLDTTLDLVVTARHYGDLLGCAGLSGDVVKCVAIAERLQGADLLPRLMLEVSFLALDRGHPHLFLYTSPRNETAFRACGFHPVVTVPDQVLMMENTPRGVHAYAEELRHYRRERDRVGAVVLNANPFTLGHRHLLTVAAARCAFLHVFVVGEDASAFPFEDRLALVRAGVAEMDLRDRIHVHPGSRYVVSKATFPTYFLKDRGIVDLAATAVDLLVFRQHIAPALGVTHRFVGSEPFCAVTRQYNADMHYWLERRDLPAAPVEVVEIPRLERGGAAISATEVRRRLAAGDVESLRRLVPRPTFHLIATRAGRPDLTDSPGPTRAATPDPTPTPTPTPTSGGA